jgi:hypothetical protein
LDCIEDLAKIFFYLAAPSAAWVALFTWQRELKGKTKYAITKQILALVIQIRGHIKIAQFRAKGVRSSRNKLACYKWLEESQLKAAELSTEVEIHWGADDSKPLGDLCAKLIDLSFVAQSYEPFSSDAEEYDNKLSKEYQEVLDGLDDTFNTEIERNLSEIKSKFKKHVQ